MALARGRRDRCSPSGERATCPRASRELHEQGGVITDDQTVTVRIPLVFRKHGGRKTVITPDGETWQPHSPMINSALVKALARAFRWRRLLDDGVYATFDDLAKAERVGQSHVSRVLRLTLLAPPIVEAILEGRAPEAMRLEDVLEGVPVEWRRQTEMISTFQRHPVERPTTAVRPPRAPS